MTSHRELFEAVRKSTKMYLQEETYACACAFVLGYDLACEGGVLSGFREWLAVRLQTGSNLSWEAIVLHAAFPDRTDPQAAVRREAGAERVAINTLFELIAEFEAARDKRDGLREIFVAYQRWLDGQGIS